VDSWSFTWGKLLGSIHGQDNFVRKPVTSKIYDHGENKSDHHALIATKHSANKNDQHGKGCQQNRGFELVCHHGFYLLLHNKVRVRYRLKNLVINESKIFLVTEKLMSNGAFVKMETGESNAAS
jgi:hypothetical protein